MPSIVKIERILLRANARKATLKIMSRFIDITPPAFG
jgi:hypothetical protein